MGAVGSRWVPWSSKPVARRSARRGGFDSHAFPPRRADVDRSPASPERRAAARGRAPAAGRRRCSPTRSRRSRGTWSRRSGHGWRPASARDASTTLADDVRERLDGFTDPSESGLTTVLNATGVILHTNLGGRRGRRPRSRPRRARRGAYLAARVRPGRRPSRPPLPCRRGPPDRPDRRRGRARHRQQRRGARPRGRAGRQATGSRSRAASWSRSAVASGSRRSSGGPAPASSRSGRRTGPAPPDFEAPLADGRATVVLRVHPSNFAQTGFVEAPDPAELARLAHEHGAIVIDDLGSGALLETAAFGFPHEPTPAERLAAGADLVTFSGDKLVGGPQAGLIVGRADLIARIRRGPAGARRPTREGDARRARRDARALPGRAGRRPTSLSGG